MIVGDECRIVLAVQVPLVQVRLILCVAMMATTLCVSAEAWTVMFIVSPGLTLSGFISVLITGGVLSTVNVSGLWLVLPTMSWVMSRME